MDADNARADGVARLANVTKEVGAALDVWLAANAGTGLLRHPQKLRAWSAEPGAALFVVTANDVVVGMLLSVPGRANDGAGDLLPELRHFTGLAVHPDHRERRFGRSLLEAAMADTRARGCRRVTLWTREDNEAGRALFESVGFRRTGRSQHDELGIIQLHYRLDLD